MVGPYMKNTKKCVYCLSWFCDQCHIDNGIMKLRPKDRIEDIKVYACNIYRIIWHLNRKAAPILDSKLIEQIPPDSWQFR